MAKINFCIYIFFLTKKDHHIPEVRHEHGRRLWFDISDISIENQLMMAELRMYKNSVKAKSANATNINYKISVFIISEFGG